MTRMQRLATTLCEGTFLVAGILGAALGTSQASADSSLLASECDCTKSALASRCNLANQTDRKDCPDPRYCDYDENNNIYCKPEAP